MRLPHVRDLDGVDAAVVGIPTDGAVVYRSGARFGPEGIRSVSVTLRNYNPMLGVDVVDKLSLVDYGDVPTVPGSTVDSLERSTEALAEIARAGVTTVCLGGDHTVLLAELRALAAVHGSLAHVQLDSHHEPRDAGRIVSRRCSGPRRLPPVHSGRLRLSGEPPSLGRCPGQGARLEAPEV
jgi:agmatinase